MPNLEQLEAELAAAKKAVKRSEPATLEARNAASQALNDARTAKREKDIAAGVRSPGVGVAAGGEA